MCRTYLSRIKKQAESGELEIGHEEYTTTRSRDRCIRSLYVTRRFVHHKRGTYTFDMLIFEPIICDSEADRRNQT